MRTVSPAPGVLERHLSSIPAFRTLKPTALASLAVEARLTIFERGEVIFRAGTSGANLTCLVRGSVRVLRTHADGKEKVVHLLQAPQLVAEVPVLMGEPYPATARCTDECTVVHLPRRALQGMIQKDPELCLHLMASLFDRLQELTRALVVHGQKSAVARVGAFLLGLSLHTPEVDLPAAKKDVANYLGLQPESFSRALATLREAGVVTVTESELRVEDRAALEGFLDRLER